MGDKEQMLNPCPFCGSTDVGGAGGIVSCYSCPATISVQNTNTFYAGELWNRRKERDSLQNRLTAEREGIEEFKGMMNKAFEDMESQLSEARARCRELESALEPFAAGGAVDCIMREDYSVMRERIKDWFGVSDFKRANEVYAARLRQQGKG